MSIRKSIALLVASVVLTGASVGFSEDAHARRQELVMTQAEARSVTVTGEGVVRVAPDRAALSLVFSERHEDLAQAHAAVQSEIQRFQDAVVGAGLPRDLVRAGALRYQPEYAYDAGSIPRFVAFNASATVTLRVDDLSTIPRVLELAMNAGAKEVHPVQYSVSNEASAQTEARRLAMEAATARANELATGFGAQVGEVLTINEQDRTPIVAVSYGRMNAMAADALSGSGASFADIDPDSVEIRASVSVRFALR